MEIERKFRLERFPEQLPLLEKSVVCQGYLSTRPAVRIRSSEKNGQMSYILCIKGKGTLVREEVELPLEEDTFLRLKNLLPGEMIRKDFRVYQLPDGNRLECSLVDEGTPTAFFYAEVEFENVEKANTFLPPDFLGEDITELPGSSMSAYWEKTRLVEKLDCKKG